VKGSKFNPTYGAITTLKNRKKWPKSFVPEPSATDVWRKLVVFLYSPDLTDTKRWSVAYRVIGQDILKKGFVDLGYCLGTKDYHAPRCSDLFVGKHVNVKGHKMKGGISLLTLCVTTRQ
jgi:hypothetical protein